MAENKQYAHIHKGVVYLINGVQKDNKATDDILLSDDNIPGIRVTITSTTDTTTGEYKLFFTDLLEVGDEYIDGKFKINNDKFTEESGRKIDSYFEYKQYLNEQKAIEEINKGTEGWTCETAINKMPFYFRAQTGTTNIIESNDLISFGLASNKGGEYNYSVEIINDTTDEYHAFDTDDALLELATNASNAVLKNCNYKLTKILSKSDISDL